MYRDDFLQHKLQERRDSHSFRKLRVVEGMVDFCSNDYLGIARSGMLATAGEQFKTGSTGSRLISGNSLMAEQTEEMIAAFHQAEAALLFNSGYDANIGLLASVPQKGDTVLYDQFSHASIRDGIRLSFAQSFSFLHNDLDDLEKKMQHATGTVFIVTESVFSMDGDCCPLIGLVTLAEKYGAHLLIDEAHATGVIGGKGEGLVQHLQVQEKIFARIHTFGKACGCHGAVVLGSTTLREYLINFARSLIYTTALPEHSVAIIRNSYQTFPAMSAEREQLNALVTQFKSAALPYELTPSDTPVQGLIVPGNEAAKALAAKLQGAGLDLRPILYPTVPKGKERLRVVLHAFNTREELGLLLNLLR